MLESSHFCCLKQDHMKYLNQLRRLQDNKRCATCTHEDRMGFKDVCMKFKIFICSDCKSAHQSFSHRCKVGARSVARGASLNLFHTLSCELYCASLLYCATMLS